jgi:hypothetical protein
MADNGLIIRFPRHSVNAIEPDGLNAPGRAAFREVYVLFFIWMDTGLNTVSTRGILIPISWKKLAEVLTAFRGCREWKRE